jgi:hypothetical protein
MLDPQCDHWAQRIHRNPSLLGLFDQAAGNTMNCRMLALIALARIQVALQELNSLIPRSSVIADLFLKPAFTSSDCIVMFINRITSLRRLRGYFIMRNSAAQGDEPAMPLN